ncbi:hypothetical protein IU485_27585 [Nocardia cyriacigeorgica]|uniref:hypothetical protein n=1 Tax=Nocardia cyriacigeorgica TaxID=135487 RepID=UPI0018958CAA|nr:hypothetical protein [Nocardia cyriacigeorgica]MBF6085139.1 hypothetical protein [Nocardia cyriacigeorgica]
MRERLPQLSAEELEQLKTVTLDHYAGANYSQSLPDRLRAYADEPDHGLINLIDMATQMALDLAASRERIERLEAGRKRRAGP